MGWRLATTHYRWSHNGRILSHTPLDLIRQGLADKQIAGAMNLSESTVHTHVRHILDKLRVHSRAAAVAICFGQTQ